MIKFMALEKKSNGEWQGHGSHEFLATPRVGEHITMNDDEGIGQAYQIIAIMHPIAPTMTAGDLIIRHVGTDGDFRQSL